VTINRLPLTLAPINILSLSIIYCLFIVGMYGQEYMDRGYVVMYLISHPYGDSSAPPYLGTAILTILCKEDTNESKNLLPHIAIAVPPRVIPTFIYTSI